MTMETTAEQAELEPTLLDTEPVSTPTEFTNGTAVTAEVPQSCAPGRAGLGGGALLLGRRAARRCAPGHSGDEYRRIRLARGRVRQPDARRRVRRASIEPSGTSIISSSK